MNVRRDPDRLIHTFLLEGEEELQDQVYDAVRAEIERKRQRVVIGPWRKPIMNKIVGFGLAAAAVVAVVLIGSQLLGSPTGGGLGSGITQSPEPSVAEPTAEPSSTPEGLLPEGPFVLGHPAGGPQVSVTIPAPGWYGEQPNGGILLKNENPDPPDGAGMIGPFFGELYVYGDPCQWSTTMPDTPATTVDEVVAALTAQASRDASAPVDITVDGYAGKSITLHVPDDVVDSECDDGKFASWAGGGEPASAGASRYHQGPGQIDELWILDVDGELIVMDANYYPETPAEHVAELHAILESITFEQPAP